MTIAPFKPTINGGRIYGRGATDVKGGLACMLHAFERLVLESPADAPSVIMSCSCDEEATATGVQALVNYWQAKPSRSRLLAIRPSMAIVAEPTELDVVELIVVSCVFAPIQPVRLVIAVSQRMESTPSTRWRR